MTPEPPFQSAAVETRFADFPDGLRAPLLTLRSLIFKTARDTNGVGPLEETLKWNEPAYLPSTTHSGTTVRIGAHGKSDDKYAFYVHCQTDLVGRYRALYGDEFEFEGNRAVVFRRNEPLPTESAAHCIAMALTYRLK